MKDKIPTIEQQNEFKKFLEEESNNKVIFSAKFGSGKTTFLKDFFKNNQQFTPVYLYPVNYSVACNEDIFELIKYDILLQLLRWEDIENYLVDIPKSLSAQFHFLNDPLSFIVSIAKAIPKLSSEIEVVQNTILGVEKLNNVVKSLNKNKETKHINHFIQSLHEKTGNIFEHNIITSIICSIIDRYKTDNAEKKIILVIDDMDRIDPEHIFRIMNVFAAHNDIEDETKNKFGFHKIITVCDIQNIQHIYHTKYGDNTDFNGYISKFHSNSIFYFSFADTIANYLDNFAEKFDIAYPTSKETFRGTQTYIIAKPILIELLLLNKININSLKYIHDINIKNKVERRKDDILYQETEPLFILYYFFEILFKDKRTLTKTINECTTLNIFYDISTKKFSTDSYEGFYYLLIEYIYLLDRYNCKRVNRHPDTIQSFSLTHPHGDIRLYYSASKFPNSKINLLNFNFTSESSDNKYNIRELKINIWDMLKQSFDFIDNLRNTTSLQ